jgi:hypothetical protein
MGLNIARIDAHSAYPSPVSCGAGVRAALLAAASPGGLGHELVLGQPARVPIAVPVGVLGAPLGRPLANAVISNQTSAASIGLGHW